MRAQTRHELSSEVVGLMSLIASNEQLASVRRRAEEGQELTPDEAYQYLYITRSFYRYWENVHYQYRRGLYDEVEFAAHREAWRSYAARSQANVDFWCAFRSEFSPEFVAEFDGVLTTYTCEEGR